MSVIGALESFVYGATVALFIMGGAVAVLLVLAFMADTAWRKAKEVHGFVALMHAWHIHKAEAKRRAAANPNRLPDFDSDDPTPAARRPGRT